jgi:DNA-directed RNA polymerase specialized sigma24 family protein
MIDLQDPRLPERLRRRTPEGRYEISDIELVQAVRRLDATGDQDGARLLCETLLQRSWPEFQRYTAGLSHRPDLREEAIANTAERMLREVKDPKEQFITQNYIHAVRCICVDEFKRVLRQEGLLYQHGSDGHPAGRPRHVPRALVEPLQTSPIDDEMPPAADVADPRDDYEQLHGEEEARRILSYLADPLDKKIMVLRALEQMKWDEIAQICGRNERTVRLRFEKASVYLAECVMKERAAYPQAKQML